jgi:hypothetical protein
MKSFTPSFPLLTAGFLAAATVSQAAITVIGNFRLGEADAGAAPGNSAGAATTNSAGIPNLTLIGTAPVYTGAVGAAGSGIAMDFTNGGYMASPLITSNNNWGIEAWVQSDNGSLTSAIAYNGNSANAGMGIYQIGGTYIGLMGGIAFVGSTPVTNAWTHLAMVVNGGTTTFYVNGVANATAGAPNTPIATNNFNIGIRPDLGERFDGRIDEVRIFSFAPGQFSVNDLQFNGVVPEPASGALLGLGLMACLRRRR